MFFFSWIDSLPQTCQVPLLRMSPSHFHQLNSMASAKLVANFMTTYLNCQCMYHFCNYQLTNVNIPWDTWTYLYSLGLTRSFQNVTLMDQIWTYIKYYTGTGKYFFYFQNLKSREFFFVVVFQFFKFIKTRDTVIIYQKFLRNTDFSRKDHLRLSYYLNSTHELNLRLQFNPLTQTQKIFYLVFSYNEFFFFCSIKVRNRIARTYEPDL